MKVGGQRHIQTALSPRERDTGTNCTGGRAGLEGCGKSHPRTDSTLRPSSL